MPQRYMCPNFNWECWMIATLQRRKLNMFKWREGILSPRALVRGNPVWVKFAAENQATPVLLVKIDVYHSLLPSDSVIGWYIKMISHPNSNASFINIWDRLIRSRPKLNCGPGRDFEVGPEFGAARKQPIIPGNSRARSCAGEEDRVTWLDLRPG